VRQLLGYERLEGAELVTAIDDLYGTWGLLHNFFCPTLKLQKKARQGAKTIRKYKTPETPYQRLLKSSDVSAKDKAAFQTRFQELNAIQLKKQLEEKLGKVFQQARTG
jgi:hypothetical protein